MEEGFKVVSNRRKKKRNKNCPKQISFFDYKHGSEIEDVSYERSISMIEKCRHEIQSDGFWIGFTDSLPADSNSELQVEEIVSYGVGHISSNPIARYQFALLILIAKHFQLTDSVHIYDPVFTLTERNIIKHFGFKLITHNEECSRQLGRATIVFMMHCGKAMYNNLLKANWGVDLQNIVLIGNSFSSYAERFPSKTLEIEAQYLCDILPYTKEAKIPNTFIHKDVFNDTAILTFPRTILNDVNSEFWTRERRELNLDNDTEIIAKSKIEAFKS
ncbi:SRR1-like protein [Rhopilema esculentum]|uniref:SRR1-like protein n=1 Tax=Rhopilema esculentum TaxID=499914 RepID=UPI0031D58550|eukprot:gene15706-7000_t